MSKISVHKTKDFSWTKFFNVRKSPATQFSIDQNGMLRFDYYTKHNKPKGRLVWDSLRKGTYVRKIHGNLI